MNKNKSAIFSISILLILSGCDKDVHNHPELVTGKQLFEHHCAGCHQSDGGGKFLKGVPANKNTQLSEVQLRHKLRGSKMEGSIMPSFPNMSEQEAEKISHYVKSL